MVTTESHLSGNLLRLECGSLDPAIVQRLAPERVEIGSRMFRLPVILDDVMPPSLRLASKKRNQFVNALAVVKRSNQGLHDADRPVISARITPGFEIMRFADMPVAKLGSFVVVKAEMNAERNLAVFE